MRHFQHIDDEPSEKVVVLDRFRSGRSLSPLRQAEAYWMALGGGTKVPRRDQLDPRGLQNILANSFILERTSNRAARFRVAGDHLTDLAGMELRGALFTTLFADEARAEAGTILQRVFSTPAVAELRLQSVGLPAHEGRMLLLPLAAPDGTVARALGVLVADGTGFLPPIRFAIADRLLRPVPVDADQKPQAPVSEPAAAAPVEGFAETQQGLTADRSHLRLIK